MNAQTAITEIWLDYYHKLTGNEGAPDYDENGSLFHWIVEHSRDFQLEILEMCYAAGYNAGLRDQTDVIETHITMLERARAVLTEVMRPIERKIEPGSMEANFFIHSLEHLTLLLHVADNILFDSLPELNEAVCRVYKTLDGGKNGGTV